MKRRLAPCLIIITAFCVAACSSDSTPSEGKSDTRTSEVEKVQPASPVPVSEQPTAQAKGIAITAFLRGAGPDEAATKAFEHGMELAVGSPSATGVKVTVLSRTQGAHDDPALPPLLTSGKTPLVVYWETADLAPAVPLLKQSNVIGVPVWNVTKKVAALGQRVYGFGYSTERSFAEYAKFAGTKLKSYRFGVISASVEPFSTQSKAFIEETKSQGNTVVFDEKAESAGVDFGALIARAKKEKCDTIFAVLPGEALVALIRAARGAAFGGKILVGDSFFSAERAILGKDAEGIYLLQAWSDDMELKSKYSAKYGIEPDGIVLGAAALGYDLIRCIEGAGESPDPDAIAHAWLSTPCEGLTGKTQFSGERIAQRQKRILTVKGERFEVAG